MLKSAPRKAYRLQKGNNSFHKQILTVEHILAKEQTYLTLVEQQLAGEAPN